jgi:hypothetical protein
MRAMDWNKGVRELPICARSFQASFMGCKDYGESFKRDYKIVIDFGLPVHDLDESVGPTGRLAVYVMYRLD